MSGIKRKREATHKLYLWGTERHSSPTELCRAVQVFNEKKRNGAGSKRLQGLINTSCAGNVAPERNGSKYCIQCVFNCCTLVPALKRTRLTLISKNIFICVADRFCFRENLWSGRGCAYIRQEQQQEDFHVKTKYVHEFAYAFATLKS